MVDLETMRAFVRRHSEERKIARAAKRAEARQNFNRIVDYFVREYRPQRVYEWGSLTRGELFCEISDIDVAVEGLDDPLAGLDAAGGAQLLTDFPLDLVELERINPLRAESIRREGRLVYERS